MLRFKPDLLPFVALMAVAIGVSSCSRSDRADESKRADPQASDTSDVQVAKADVKSREKSATGQGMIKASGEATDVVVETERPRPTPPPKLPPPEGARRLHPDFDVWLDEKDRVVLVDGNISLREGMLEMFACLRGTKEHESIISANTRASVVHAALIALGADPGTPVEFVPMYKPPTGPEIEILVQWIDEDGNEETVRAQELIKDIRTEKAMTHAFVFAGSLFWKDSETGREYYLAEQGDFICVSNFGTAMIDIPVESSQSLEQLAFAAFTERIPPLGTPVRLILKPKVKTLSDGAPPIEEKRSANDQNLIERETSRGG
jgi:hypothetical protein